MDIALALLVLIRPVRLALLWMAFGDSGRRLSAGLSGPTPCGILWNDGRIGARHSRCSSLSVGRELFASGLNNHLRTYAVFVIPVETGIQSM